MSKLIDYTFQDVTLYDIENLRQLQIQDLRQYVNNYFEQGIINYQANSVGVFSGHQVIGYACIGTVGPYRDAVLEYYLLRSHRKEAAAVLHELKTKYACKSWFVSTHDSFALPLMLDMSISHYVSGYMFSASGQSEIDAARTYQTEFALTNLDDLESVYSLEIQDDYYSGDIEGVRSEIEAGSSYSLRMGEDLVGTGFVVKLERTPRFADIGMIVHPAYRRQGWGTHIIQCLMHECSRLGLVPTACCDSKNLNSRRTLETVGFYLDGCALRVPFE